MHQYTTPSLSLTIWPRWSSRQFLILPIVPVTFGCSLSSQAVVVKQLKEEMKEAVSKVIDTPTQEYFHAAFQKLLERYKCIAAGGDYFEGGLEFHVCTINKSAYTTKSGNLFNDLRIYDLALNDSQGLMHHNAPNQTTFSIWAVPSCRILMT